MVSFFFSDSCRWYNQECEGTISHAGDAESVYFGV